MLSRLQELRREEETLLRVKAALHDQLHRLRVEELALQSMIGAGEENVPVPLAALAEDTEQTLSALGQMDNEAAINQTELHLSLQDDKEEEEEEEEESDS
ncbi:SNPC5 protein, partial [Spelaeornis formosus]|nr:SNPC5 protein [Elachura formosa]